MFIRYFNEKDPHSDSPYNITVNVAERKLSLFKEGKLIKTYPIAVGKPSTPTPKGNFTI